MCPLRKLHFVHSFTVCSNAQIQSQLIREERWIVHVELGGELFDVAWVVERAVPLLLDAFEEPVRVVVSAALELDHPLRVLTNQEPNDVSRTAIMSAE